MTHNVLQGVLKHTGSVRTRSASNLASPASDLAPPTWWRGRAVVVAGELDIPLFVVPVPGDPMVRPQLQPKPLGVRTPEDHALFAAVQAFNEAPGSDVRHRFSYETVEDEHGRQVPWRFSGSARGFGNGYPLVGSAILAERCTWSCERAREAFEIHDPWSELG